MRRGLRRCGARAAGLLALLLLGAGAARAVDTSKPPPAPRRWVTDNAGLLSPPARQQLDLQLEDYQRRTGHQVLVWIGDTTGAVPIEDFANAAFQAWRVGRKGIDDGLVVFVMAKDRKVRFEVGYGLEGRLPDAIGSRIIREILAPRLQAGDADGAIAAAVAAATAAIDGRDWRAAGGAAPPGAGATASPGAGEGGAVPMAPGERVRRVAHQLSLPQMILLGILGLAVLFFLVTHPSFALWLLFNILSGRGGGGEGGGGGGGGFSGGGGRSGGGGASGSW
jgi:uncharacterized protein